ncbi:MAG: Scr1 family TA system antitoxin-like transcriptional regulator [Actinomycetota bacterium]
MNEERTVSSTEDAVPDGREGRGDRRRTGLRARFAERRRRGGFTQETLARAIGVTAQTVASWERGKSDPSNRHRVPMADQLGLTLDELDLLLDNFTSPEDEAGGRGAGPDGRPSIPPMMRQFTSNEDAAAVIKSVGTTVLPGLLQTAAYAEAAFRGACFYAGEDDLAAKLDVRMARQAVLRRQPVPAVLHAVIDESTLDRVAGDRAVMAGQMAHLQVLAQWANVELQVLPRTSDALLSLTGDFMLLVDFGASTPSLAYLEDHDGMTYLSSRPVVDGYNSLFRHVSDASYSSSETLALLAAKEKEYRDEQPT